MSGERPPRGRFRPVPEWASEATRALHAGLLVDRNAGAIVPPIYQTSTFLYPGERSESSGTGEVYLYSRHDNPTVLAAAELLRALEGGEAARLCASGMGAVSATLLGLLRSGDEVVALDTLYGGTLGLLRDLLPRWGIRVRWVSREEASAPERCLGPASRLVYLESPTNPTLEVVDLERWARAARAVGAVSVVDGTFATPVNQRPLGLGIDLVLHSGTKYLAGHSDVLAGAVVGRSDLLETIRKTQELLGSPLDPHAAFLLARGMRTLNLRVSRQNETAGRLAHRFADHPRVTRVAYPGRSSPEAEAIVRRQMTGRGGVLSLSVRGGLREARAVLGRLQIFSPAASLGGVESLASLPAETSHVGLSAEERARRGIDEGMIRLSVGLEAPEDLERDLTEALDRPPG